MERRFVHRQVNKVPGRRNHPPIPQISPNVHISEPGIADSIQVEKDIVELRSRNAAMVKELIHYGTDEVVDRVETLLNPNFLTGVKVGVDSLVSFRVPDNTIFELNKIGVYYSEPIVAKCRNAVGWRLVVESNRILYVSDPDENEFFLSLGDVQRPMEISSLYIQAGETVSIELRSGTSFNEFLTMVGRLSGRLYKPTSQAL